MANMDLMALLSTVVLVATIATTIFAVAAYMVSRGYIKSKKTTSAPLPGTTAIPRQPVGPRVITGNKGPILKRYNHFEEAGA